MAARIDAGTVVTLAYELRASDGEIPRRAGRHGRLPARRLRRDLSQGGGGAARATGPGHVVEISLEPEDAFGDYDPELLRVEPREAFPEVLQVGMRFEGVPGDAPADELVVYTVTGIADEQVVVDGNHPLAGERVLFKCTVTDVRPATAGRASPRPRARRALAGERGEARLPPRRLGARLDAEELRVVRVHRDPHPAHHGASEGLQANARSRRSRPGCRGRGGRSGRCACRRARRGRASPSRRAPTATCASSGVVDLVAAGLPRVRLRHEHEAAAVRRLRRGEAPPRSRRGWLPSGSAARHRWPRRSRGCRCCPPRGSVAKTTPFLVQSRFSGSPGHRQATPSRSAQASCLASGRRVRPSDQASEKNTSRSFARRSSGIHLPVGIAAAVRPVVVAGREDERMARRVQARLALRVERVRAGRVAPGLEVAHVDDEGERLRADPPEHRVEGHLLAGVVGRVADHREGERLGVRRFRGAAGEGDRERGRRGGCGSWGEG